MSVHQDQLCVIQSMLTASMLLDHTNVSARMVTMEMGLHVMVRSLKIVYEI